jgi:hypothetical protein
MKILKLYRFSERCMWRRLLVGMVARVAVNLFFQASIR